MPSLYERLGLTSTISLAIETTPAPWLVLLPITYHQFATVLQQSQDLKDFESRHCDKKRTDPWYRIFRPRGKEAIEILRDRYRIS